MSFPKKSQTQSSVFPTRWLPTTMPSPSNEPASLPTMPTTHMMGHSEKCQFSSSSLTSLTFWFVIIFIKTLIMTMILILSNAPSPSRLNRRKQKWYQSWMVDIIWLLLWPSVSPSRLQSCHHLMIMKSLQYYQELALLFQCVYID